MFRNKLCEMSDGCQYFKFGFCKYKDYCIKEHVKKICDKKQCDVKRCNFRHPKNCSYFKQFNYCKFGDFCLYRHEKKIDDNNEVLNNTLETILKEKVNLIDRLEIKILSLEKRLDALENVTSDTEKYNLDFIENINDVEDNGNTVDCELCGERFDNESDLKIHLNIHDVIPQVDGTEEKEIGYVQGENIDDDIPENWPDEDLEDFIIKCKVCGEEFDGKTDYNFHIDVFYQCKIRTNQKCPYRNFIVV